MDVFNLFTSSPYTFLQLSSSAGGNIIDIEYETTGIVKLRDGISQADNMGVYTSESTVHIRPSDTFVSVLGGNLVGHGIRATNNAGETVDYKIIGQVEGYDFDSGTLSFYKVTVKKESLAPCPSDLPLI